MALAAAGSEVASAATPGAASGHYRVEAMMISLPISATEIPTGPVAGIFADDFVARLLKRPKADILSFPRVESVDSFPSHIGVTQQVALPDGKSRETGINFDVVPQKKGADIGFLISIKEVQFHGFTDRGATKPIFNTERLSAGIPASERQPMDYYYCYNLPAQQKIPITYDVDGRQMASVADANERQLLFVKITRG